MAWKIDEQYEKDYAATCDEIDRANRLLEYEYQQELKAYELNVQKAKEDCEKERIKKNTAILFIGDTISNLENLRQSIINTLNDAYELKVRDEDGDERYILYPKYRGLVPVTTLTEYLDSGICRSLEDANGAYNKYDTELLARKIIGCLDDISTKMDLIQRNQFILYQTIEKANELIDQLTSTVMEQTQAMMDGFEQLDETMAKQVQAYYDLREDITYQNNENQHMMEVQLKNIAAQNRVAADNQVDTMRQQNALLEYNNRVMSDIRLMQEYQFWDNL